MAALVLLFSACAKSEVLEPAEQMEGMPEGIVVTPSADPVPTFTRELIPVTFSAGIEANPADAPAVEPQAPAVDGEGTNSEENPDSEEGDAVEPEEEGTKAYVDRPHFYWQTGDQVGIYGDTFPGKYDFTATANASNARYATLAGGVPGEANHWYGVYPADAAAVFSNGSCTLTLPHVQTMGANHVDPAALLTVTTGEGMSLSFHNVFALLSFTVSNADIKHIQLIGNKGSVIAGTVVVDPATGNVTAIKDPKTEIHLYPKSGDTYFATNTEYFVPILPYVSGVTGSLIGDVLFNGFTLIMYTGSETTNNEKCYIKRTDKTLTLVRNQGQKLGNICSGCTTSSQSYSNDCAARYRNSSALNFGFTPVSDHAFRAAVYADAACTDLVVAHNISADLITSVFNKSNSLAKYLTVGGLQSGKAYYFRGIDMTTGRPTMIRSFSTSSFTVKEMAKTAAAGDVVLAEDFSELCFHGARTDGDSENMRGVSCYRGNNGRLSELVPFKGEIPEGNATDGPAFYTTSGEEARMFAFYRTALPATRLAEWAEYSEQQAATTYTDATAPVCARNGILKIGAAGYTGGIVTPPLDFIPADKKATISVKVRASRFGVAADNEKYLGVKTVSGSVKPITPASDTYTCDRFFVVDQVYDTKLQTLDDNNDYKDYTLSLTAYSGNRIIIGADRTTPGTSPGTQCRLYISEVTLTLTALDNIPTSQGALTLSKVSWTEGTVSWTSTSGQNYQVYIDGSAYGSQITASSGTTTQRITGLHNGTTYRVEVRNVTTSASVGSIYMTTASLWQNTNGVGQRFVSIGWSQLYRTTQGGSDQAYQVQVSKAQNAESANIVYDFVPQTGQLNGEDCVYGNNGISGKGTVKDGTSLNQGDVWGGTLTCGNYMTPTGVSVGGLNVNTTYYVRVRTRASVTYSRVASKGGAGSSVTVTHRFGDSNWSDWVPMKTEAAHTPAANELLYCGFEDACVQQDYSNRTGGTVPYAYPNNYDVNQATLLYSGKGAVWSNVCIYVLNKSGHLMDDWNLACSGTNVDGTAALRGFLRTDAGNSRATVGNINNATVGDFGGWYCYAECRPRMGQIHLISNTASNAPFVNTPALTNDLLGAKALSPTGTACTLSFHAVYSTYRNSVGSGAGSYSVDLYVRVYRASNGAWEEEPAYTIAATDLKPYSDAGVSDTYYYKNDYSKRPSKHFSVPLTLYPGDAVKLEASHYCSDGDRVYGIILDDILLVKND